DAAHAVRSGWAGRCGPCSGRCAMITRRGFIESSLATSAVFFGASRLHAAADLIAAYRTPYKYPELVLQATGNKQNFDGRSVDDLVRWTRTALVGPRDPNSRFTKYNLAISSILRDKNLHGTGEAIKVNGQYLAAWNAYPSAGYEEGAALIGLARSHDLLHWTLSDPILRPEEGAAWE